MSYAWQCKRLIEDDQREWSNWVKLGQKVEFNNVLMRIARFSVNQLEFAR